MAAYDSLSEINIMIVLKHYLLILRSSWKRHSIMMNGRSCNFALAVLYEGKTARHDHTFINAKL